MRILLTNDDGVHAAGIAALAAELQSLGEVCIVAPAHEQSGVSQTVTFQTPLVPFRVYRDGKHWAWAVDGSPADCVKLGATQLLDPKPDVVVSGINGGQNAGISVLYSGTVGAALEGVIHGYPSFAVSLAYDQHARFDRAAAVAVPIIKKILDTNGSRAQLYNINIPTEALATTTSPRVVVVPMDTRPYWDSFEKRTSPRGGSYYWLTGDPDPSATHANNTSGETDLEALHRGFVTITPLTYDLTHHSQIDSLKETLQ
ncbi:MAG: 5'/3'-nucleotidase SurE [Thermoguttaceae bacterium]